MTWGGALWTALASALLIPCLSSQTHDFVRALEARDQSALTTWAQSNPELAHGRVLPIINGYLASDASAPDKEALECLSAALQDQPAGQLAARVLAWNEEQRWLFHSLHEDLESEELALEAVFLEAAALGCESLLLRAVGDRGQLDYNRGELALALQSITWVAAHAERAKALGQRAWSAGWLGNLHWELGDFDQAAHWLEAAARLEEVRGDDAYRVRLYTNLSRIRGSGGEIKASIEWADRAERLARATGDDLSLCEALLVRAGLHIDLGQHERALELSLQLGPASGPAAASGGTLVRVDMVTASALSDIGRFESALGFARRALKNAESEEVAREMPLLVWEARLILGLLLGDLGHWSEGLAQIERVHAPASQRGDARAVAWAKKNEGWIRLASGDFEAAALALEAARSYGAAAGESFLEGVCALGVAESLVLGAASPMDYDAERVQRLLASAERLGAKLGDLEFRWRVSTLRGRMHALAGEKALALEHFGHAVVAIERWRRRLASPALLTHALRQRTDPYRAAASAAVHLGRLDQALYFTELLHARVLREQQALPSRAAGSDPELESLRSQIALLAFQVREGRTTHELEKQLAHAEEQLDARLLANELQQGVQVAPLARTKAAHWSASIAASDVDLVLDYLVGSEETFVFTLDASGSRVVRLPVGEEQLAELVGRMRAPLERLRRGEIDLLHMDLDLRAARELYAILVAPALPDDLAPNALLGIIPDGCLTEVPFELFVSGGMARPFDRERPFAHLSGFQFLGDQHALVYLSSVAALERGNGQAILQVSVVLPPSDVGVAQADAELQAIRSSYAEARLLSDASVEDLARLSSESEGHGKAVHISAHGLIDGPAGAPGRMLLGGGAAQQPALHLEPAHVEALGLDAQLVVLSACHTGEGEWISGEGSLGLTRSFLVAGAAEVVASLWAVDDAGTVAFMDCFYAALKQGHAPARALFLARARTKTELHPSMSTCWILRR